MSWLIWCGRGAADCAVFRWEQAAHSCYSRQPKPRKAQWMCNVSGMVYQLFFFKYLQSCLLGIVCVWKWDSNLIKCYDLSLSIADAQPQAVQSSPQVLLYKRECWLAFMTVIWIFLQVLHVNLECKRRVYWFILPFRQAFSANICKCWHDTYASCGFQYLKFCQICSQFTFSFLPSH